MRWFCVFVFAALLMRLGHPAYAQTDLVISVTGFTMAVPNKVFADLSFDAYSAYPSTAEATADTAISGAAKMVQAVPGVALTAIGYPVYPRKKYRPSASTRFTARARLELEMSTSGESVPVAFLDLIEQLSDYGFVLDKFGAELSEEGQEAADQRAVADAIAQIKSQEGLISNSLHEGAGTFKSINVKVSRGNAASTRSLEPSSWPMGQVDGRAEPSQMEFDSIPVFAYVTADIVIATH